MSSRRFVKNVAYVGTITTHYRTQHANFLKSTAWSFPCTAGETIAVIDYNGDVRACELREKFASLKDYDFDFGALWANQRKAVGADSHRWRQSLLVHARLLHSRLDATFPPRAGDRRTKELPDQSEVVKRREDDSQDVNRKSGIAYGAAFSLFAAVCRD